MIVDPIFSQAFPVPVPSILQAGDQLEGGDMSTDTYVEGVCTPSRSSSPISIYYHYGRLPLEPNKTFQFPTFENGQMFIHVVPYAKRHPELERRAPSPDPDLRSRLWCRRTSANETRLRASGLPLVRRRDSPEPRPSLTKTVAAVAGGNT